MKTEDARVYVELIKSILRKKESLQWEKLNFL